jgi:hypothetical protein
LGRSETDKDTKVAYFFLISLALVICVIISVIIISLDPAELWGAPGPITYPEGFVKHPSIAGLWFEGSNPNVLLVNLSYVGGSNGLLSGVTVQDKSRYLVVEGDVSPSVLSDFKETLTINLHDSLSSGNYDLAIRFENSGVVRESFTVP